VLLSNPIEVEVVAVSNTYCIVFSFVCILLVYPMLPIYQDYHFLIAPSVFSNVYVVRNELNIGKIFLFDPFIVQ